MRFLRLIPAILSISVLSAHFFRAQSIIPTLVSLSLLPLVFYNGTWSRNLVRICLAIGSIEWLRTMLVLVMQREAMGLPWVRMAMILLAVVCFTMTSAFLLKPQAAT